MGAGKDGSRPLPAPCLNQQMDRVREGVRPMRDGCPLWFLWALSSQYGVPALSTELHCQLSSEY